jgi:hypothetical protein
LENVLGFEKRHGRSGKLGAEKLWIDFLAQPTVIPPLENG